ncbi:hypothetical protein RN001_000960 [Aquatica leii]|uniref:Proton-coupled folate transporter n=1 Tax=Aquatica leii TaxID=1421715 RepID=A0AAN7Q3J0_9COLE|nr:hypothetical protein RN001_000960 [Aquatica leii]
MVVSNLDNSVPKYKNIWNNICVLTKNVTIEPVILLFTIPHSLVGIPLSNLFLEKACRTVLMLNETLCDSIVTGEPLLSDHEEVKLQKQVTTMIAWTSMIKGAVPGFLLLFLGAWSDRGKTLKPFIILPFVGELFRLSNCLISTYFFDKISLNLTGLVNSIFYSLSGGSYVFSWGIFHYISVISTNESRTVRFGVINFFSQLSATIGVAFGGRAYRQLGLKGTFWMCMSIYIIGILYVLLFLKETIIKTEKPHMEESKEGLLSKFILILNDIKNTVMIIFRKRQNDLRLKICLNVLIIILMNGVTQANILLYFLARKRYGWNEIGYSDFSAISSATHSLGMLFGIFYGISSVSTRSIITKLVSPDELGTVNGLIESFQAFLPLFFAPFFSMIYRYTVNIHDGIFLFVTSGILVPVVAIYSYQYISNRYERLNDNDIQN